MKAALAPEKELDFTDMEVIILASVCGGLPVDHMNAKNFSVLDYAAEIGTLKDLFGMKAGCRAPINYDRYFRVKALLVKLLSDMQVGRNNIQMLPELAQMPMPVIEIIRGYVPDRSEELRYVRDYRIPGESPAVVRNFFGNAYRRIDMYVRGLTGS